MALGQASTVHAETSVIRGHVVSIEAGDVVVDLAGQRGAKSGDIIELWRPLRLRHPVTNKMVSDRFRIGSLKLGQVRDQLALAVAEGKLDRAAVPGDVVILRRVSKPELLAPPVDTAAIEPSGPPADGGTTVAPSGKGPRALVRSLDPKPRGEAAAVAALFSSLSGRGLRKRITTYEGYVRSKPDSPYARVFYEEAVFLRNLLTKAARKPRGRPPRIAHFAPPKEALAAQPLTLALELSRAVNGALIHTRSEGELSYVSTAMRHLGGGYYSVTLPAGRLVGPQLEYFIEATNAAGKSAAVVGTARTPSKLDLRDTPTSRQPSKIITTVSL